MMKLTIAQLNLTVGDVIQRSEYKHRQAPPLIRLCARVFGHGWQMPIAVVFPGVLS